MNTVEKKKLKDGDDLTPKEIVRELDKYIVSQNDAKKAVSIALRNRYRRQKLPKEIAEDIIPKNILMIGPTGVGKTEIARRLAKLTQSPFIKIEASKFTEVGYVGRDVESIVRDLARIAVDLVKVEKMEVNLQKAKQNVEEKILSLLLPEQKKVRGPAAELDLENKSFNETKEKLRKLLRDGKLNDKTVEVEVKPPKTTPFEIFSASGVEEIGITISEMMPNMFGGGKSKKRKMTIGEATEYLVKDEQNRLLDMDEISKIAVHRAEQMGIVFLDEIDKIAGRESGSQGPMVSREGVQRDLLPIIEGTTVNTKYGMVKTDHILFVGTGAFHVTSPSDLIPELQGRFPIRVELLSLSQGDFIKILTEPKNALVKQYQSLMSTEGLDIQFTKDAITEIAKIAEDINSTSENIGARRLHTIMEKVMEEISFEASEIDKGQVKIDRDYVLKKVEGIAKDSDLSKYIL
jgi:ATP-dependent HslUV protease ATP-binding subunit HslU